MPNFFSFKLPFLSKRIFFSPNIVSLHQRISFQFPLFPLLYFQYLFFSLFFFPFLLNLFSKSNNCHIPDPISNLDLLFIYISDKRPLLVIRFFNYLISITNNFLFFPYSFYLLKIPEIYIYYHLVPFRSFFSFKNLNTKSYFTQTSVNDAYYYPY